MIPRGPGPKAVPRIPGSSGLLWLLPLRLRIIIMNCVQKRAQLCGAALMILLWEAALKPLCFDFSCFSSSRSTFYWERREIELVPEGRVCRTL